MADRAGCCRSSDLSDPFRRALLSLFSGLLFPAALFLNFLFPVVGTAPLYGLSVTVSGGAGFSIGVGDLIGGAGSDLNPEYNSAVDAVQITVADSIDSGDAWQIQVRQEDVLWHGSLDLSVLRTGTGSGTGSVTGGDVLPVGLTSVDQVFFDGSGDVADIPVRLDLSGVSVLVPVDSYSATLYFTIVDIP